MPIDVTGYLSTAHFIASSNCDERPVDTEISLLVIHNISLPPGEFGGSGVIDLFTNQINPAAHPYYQSIHTFRVSSHFFIRRDGELLQFVSCTRRAWHAGISHWKGKDRCNDHSIGIELEGSDTIAFTDSQYSTLTTLTRCLCARYPITDIVGHSDIAPDRKTDPGPCFDWRKYSTALGSTSYFSAQKIGGNQ